MTYNVFSGMLDPAQLITSGVSVKTSLLLTNFLLGPVRYYFKRYSHQYNVLTHATVSHLRKPTVYRRPSLRTKKILF